MDSGDLDAVKKLLENGKDPDLPTLSGDTPLMRAAQNGDEKMAGLLLLKGAQVNFQNKQGKTALMSAVQFEQIEMIKYLVAKGARLDLKDMNGQSALNLAFQSSNKGVFDLLIDVDLIQKGFLNSAPNALAIARKNIQQTKADGREYTD